MIETDCLLKEMVLTHSLVFCANINFMIILCKIKDKCNGYVKKGKHTRKKLTFFINPSWIHNFFIRNIDTQVQRSLHVYFVSEKKKIKVSGYFNQIIKIEQKSTDFFDDSQTTDLDIKHLYSDSVVSDGLKSVLVFLSSSGSIEIHKYLVLDQIIE